MESRKADSSAHLTAAIHFNGETYCLSLWALRPCSSDFASLKSGLTRPEMIRELVDALRSYAKPPQFLVKVANDKVVAVSEKTVVELCSGKLDAADLTF